MADSVVTGEIEREQSQHQDELVPLRNRRYPNLLPRRHHRQLLARDQPQGGRRHRHHRHHHSRFCHEAPQSPFLDEITLFHVF